MSIFAQVEGVYNSTRELRSISKALYKTGRKLDRLKEHINNNQNKLARSREQVPPPRLLRERQSLLEDYQRKAEKFGKLTKDYTDQMVKINAHLREAHKAFQKN